MTSLAQLLPIDWILAAVALLLAVGVGGLARPASLFLVARVLFPLGAAFSLLIAIAALAALFSVPQVAVLPLGLPGLPFHLRLDALSAFFLFLFGGATAGISIFASGYFRKGEGTPPGLLCLQYHVFVASMALIMLADDAYVFMVMWEVMALSSFFLVTCESHDPRNPPRRLFVSADCAHRRARDSAVFRRIAGEYRRLHLCQHAGASS